MGLLKMMKNDESEDIKYINDNIYSKIEFRVQKS